MQTEQTLLYRYPGTKPFEAIDYALFRGRDEDIIKLFDLTFIENPVVLFSRSGLGKSSLLNAGLYNKIIKEDKATPLFIRFGAYYKNTPIVPLQKLGEVIAKESENVSAEKVAVEENPFFEKLVAELNDEQNALWYKFKKMQVEEPTKNSFVLIFDQFEELFTYPQLAINQFKKQLSELIYIKVPQELRDLINEKRKADAHFISKEEANKIFAALDIRILFSIRSDKVSLLNSLTDFFPTILKNCYELKPLSREQAKQAIICPAKLMDDNFESEPFEFETDVLDYILDSLTETNSHDVTEGIKEKSEIETFQLQIVCKYAENLVIEKGLKEVTKKDLGDIDLIFENQYKNIINKLPAAQQLPVRIMTEEKLIVEKTRVSMPEIALLKEGREKGLTSELIDYLVNTHIIRRDQNGTVEISHDTLIEPILKYYDERQKQETIEKELQQKEEQIKKIEAEQKVRAKRNKLVITIVSIFLIVTICLAVFAIIKSKEAERQRGIAEQKSLEADKQRDSANLMRLQVDSNSRIINEILFGSGNQNNKDTTNQNSSPSVIALSRAYNDYNVGAKEIPMRNSRGPFVSKYLLSAKAADDSDWNVAFVIWCFTYNNEMKNIFSDFADARYPANFLKLLTAKGYVVNEPPEKEMPGDIVFFDFGEHKGAQTCGIVFNVDVNKGFVYSIEGNMDNNGKVRTVTRYLADVLSYARIPGGRIYILAGSKDKTVGFNALQSQLTTAGFSIMGAKYLNDNGRPDGPEIRYFNASDKGYAEKIATFMQAKIPNQTYVAKQYQANTAKPGYIEIWLGR